MKASLFIAAAAFCLLNSVTAHATENPRALSVKENEWLEREVHSLVGAQLRNFPKSMQPKLEVDVRALDDHRFSVDVAVVAGGYRKVRMASTLTRREDGNLHLAGQHGVSDSRNLRTPGSAVESVAKRTNVAMGGGNAVKAGELGDHTTVVGFSGVLAQGRVTRHVVSNAHGYPIKSSHDMTSEATHAATTAMETRGWNVRGASVIRLNARSVDVKVHNSNNLFGGLPDSHVVRIGLNSDGRLNGKVRAGVEFKGQTPRSLSR